MNVTDQTAEAAPLLGRAALSAGEVAELIGVSRWKVADMARRGDVPCKRIGRRVVFPVQPLLAWLNGK